MNINSYIELTNIDPHAKSKDIRALCRTAAENNCRSVVINPEWVHHAREILGRLERKDIKVVQVHGFPTSKSDLLEGDEVDVFIKIKGVSRNKSTKAVANGTIGLILERLEAKGVSRKNVKAVIETRVLSKDDVIEISRILCKHKIGWIKSSTGLFKRTNERTNLEDLKLIKEGVKLFGVSRERLLMYQPKIKISGGIRTVEDAEALIKDGAELLGTSKVLK